MTFIQVHYFKTGSVFNPIWINVADIEFLEPEPHTVNVKTQIVMRSGTRLRVKESADEIVKELSELK